MNIAQEHKGSQNEAYDTVFIARGVENCRRDYYLFGVPTGDPAVFLLPVSG